MATLTKRAYVCSGGEVTPSPFGGRPRGCESLKAPQTGAGGPASAGGARTLPIRLRLTTTTRLSFLPSITAPSRSNHNQASSLPPLKLCSIQPWHNQMFGGVAISDIPLQPAHSSNPVAPLASSRGNPPGARAVRRFRLRNGSPTAPTTANMCKRGLQAMTAVAMIYAMIAGVGSW